MNILILVSSLNYGGAEKQAVLDANMLAASGEHQIFVGTFQEGPLREQLSPQVHLQLFEKKDYLSTAFQIARFNKRENIQLVHNHLYAPMIIASLASLIYRVPVLWHFHGHHFEVKKYPLNLLSRLPTVKRIIFVCAALGNYFDKNFSFPKSKLTVVHNSSQCRKTRTDGAADQRISIGYVGRLVKLKRIHLLINLAEHLLSRQIHHFEIVIAGDGPERENLEALCRKKGLEKYVKFLGFRSDIENVFNSFDIFVLPSEEEAFSLSLIDAGNCGLPSIAFDVGGNKEIVQDGQTGFIIHTEDALKEKAALLCTDAGLRRKMGGQAEAYTKKFSEQQHLRDLLKIYRSLAPSQELHYAQ
jgi:glycosyltransferase involved in cell wall biosynthesis